MKNPIERNLVECQSKVFVCSRRAQMEIIGLAFIVILMILGMIFAIRFVVLQPSQSVRPEFTRTQLASNTLHAIVSTTTECNSMSFEKILIDCAENLNVPTNQVQCPTNPSCLYARGEIAKILDTTFDKYGIDNYNFTALIPVSGGKSLLFNSIGKGRCGEIRKIQPQYYRTSAGTLEIYLAVCQ